MNARRDSASGYTGENGFSTESMHFKQKKNTMFPWRAQNILQQCDLYGSLTFLTLVSEKLPGYILFFCKVWIKYIGKMKN